MSTPHSQRSLLPKDDGDSKGKGKGKKRAAGEKGAEKEPSQSSSSSSLYSVLPLGPNTQAGTSSRRRIIQNACEPCRKRKVKCDGGFPSCSTCDATPQTECYYETDADRRRKGALRRDIEILTQQNNNLSEENSNLSLITKAIRQGSDKDVEDIVYLLRSNETYDFIAKCLEDSTIHDLVNARATAQGSLDTELAEFSKLTLDTFTEGGRYGLTSGLGAVQNLSHSASPSTPSRNNTWIALTNDSGFIHHLMDMYFTWHHPIFDVFSQELFIHDMETGESNHCSSLLVNAILAMGCHFSDRYAEARTDPKDPRTAGARFILEAKRLLAEDEEACLTSVQALAILSVAHGMAGQESMAFRHNHIMMAMIVELGMHRSGDGAEGLTDPSTPATITESCRTFWACYNISTIYSLGTGRLPLLPVTAITTPRISVDSDSKPATWRPVFESRYERIPAELEQPNYPNTYILYSGLLCDIINDMLFMFFAPRERLTSRVLLMYYARFQSWYADLPKTLAIKNNQPSPAHVLYLHALYHSCVIHLFRPFMKVTLIDSTVIPREVCTQSAIIICRIFDHQRGLYGLRRASAMFQHGLMIAATVRIYNISENASMVDAQAATDVAAIIVAFSDMAVHHYFAVRVLQILLGLASRLPNIPTNLQTAINEGRLTVLSTYDSWQRQKNIQDIEMPQHAAPEMQSGHTSFQGTTYALSESVGHPGSGLSSRGSGVDLTNYQQAGSIQQPGQASMSPYHLQPPSVRVSPQIPVSYQEDFFWNPYPGQGLPLQLAQMPGVNQPYNIMPDPGAPPSGSGDMTEQMTRDGFGTAEGGWYQNQPPNPWNQERERRG